MGSDQDVYVVTKDTVELVSKDDDIIPKDDDDEFDAEGHIQKVLDEEETREAWGNKAEFLLASIGLAVGVGNVWRFPYLCQKNGGGAFLVPYVFMMVFQGFPLFIMEFAIGQRMKQSAVRCWNNVHPVFFGVGISCMVIAFVTCSYYIVVITWCLYYLFVSLTNNLPWQVKNCDRADEYANITANYTWWAHKNQSNQFVANMTLLAKSVRDNFPDCCVADPPQYFWYHNALQATSTIEQPGDVNWKMFGCLVAGWILVYFCVLKGVKSSGKAAYFTATFPYIILFILFVRAITLEGATDGIKSLFIPEPRAILKFEAWVDAATQIFYSVGIGFGALIVFASYMPRRNNCVNDALVVVLVNCGTSLFAAIVTFSYLGYRFHKTKIPINQVGSGPGLAFMTYCEAFLLLDVSPLWAVLFFLMLILLGIDSEFGTLEAAVAPLYDLKWVLMCKEKFMAIIAFGMILLGMVFCLGNGYYIFQVVDDYVVPIPLLFIAFFQVVALGWVYGTDKISNDIEFMTGKRPHFFWLLCWKYISPCILLIVIFGELIVVIGSTPTYRGYVGCIQNAFNPLISEGSVSWYKRFKYPWWTQLLTAALIFFTIFPVIFYFIKNWRYEYFGKIKTQLMRKSTYYPDPTYIEPHRKISPDQMERIIREEDRAALIKMLVGGGDKRFTSLRV